MDKLTGRLVVGVAALVVGLLLGWMVRGVTTYNKDMETVATYQDWRTACPAASTPAPDCEMVQEVLDSKTVGEIARLTITKDAGKSVLGVTLPLGVALQPGVGLVFGNDPVKPYPYRTCNAQGCIAVIPIDDKVNASLNAGKDGRVLFAGAQDNKPVAMPLSLKGYAEAAHAYRSGQAKRSSWFWRLWS